MKKKIGEIYNRPVVIGDRNLVTKNETHISELQENNEGEGENSNVELTKGKKILSEYYYINEKKLIEDEISGIIPNGFGLFLAMFFSADSDDMQEQKLIRIGDEEFGLSEHNHSIYKVTFNNTTIYYEDNIPGVNAEEVDVSQVAVRKYCKAYFDNKELFSSPNIYISINELFDSTKVFSASFDEIIAPYLITEEEFWAEAEIINDINEIS